MAIFGLILLMTAFWFSRKKDKAYVIYIVSIAYLINWAISQSVLDRFLNDVLGYYVSQSVFEVFVVMMLLQKPIREGLIIMILCLFAVLLNITGFVFEVLNQPIDNQINYAMWGLFTAQLIILFSTRIADGVFRNIAKSSLANNFCANYFKINLKG